MAMEWLSPADRAAFVRAVGSSDPGMIGNWADSIRTVRAETKPWHFVDIPRTAKTFDAARDCPGQCLLSALEMQIARATAGNVNVSIQREALLFAVHLVEDLHQPFHCYDDHDAGGNAVAVWYHGMPQNLHALWDDLLVPGPISIDRRQHPSLSVRRSDLLGWINASHRLSQRAWLRPSSVVSEEYLRWGRRMVRRQCQLAARRTAAVLHQILTVRAR